MKLIDMKSEKESKDSTMLSPMMENEYPYGLRISLDDATLTKLGMVELPEIDSEFKLMALCCVVSVGQHERKDDAPSRHVELQIEQMIMVKAAEEEGEDKGEDDTAKGMYPSMAA
jgi:hypothetical protein